MQLALHRCSEPAVTVMAGSLWVCSLPDVRLGLQEVAERNNVPEVLMGGGTATETSMGSSEGDV